MENTERLHARTLAAVQSLMEWFQKHSVKCICTDEEGNVAFKFKDMANAVKLTTEGEWSLSEMELSWKAEYLKRSHVESVLIDFIDPHDYREMNETDSTHVMFDMNVDNEFWEAAKGYTEQDLESLADMGVFPRVSVEVDKENRTAVVMFGDDEDSFDVLEITSSDRCRPFLEMAGAVKYPTP